MQANGYRIIPVNPNATEVLGEKAYASLTEAARHEKNRAGELLSQQRRHSLRWLTRP